MKRPRLGYGLAIAFSLAVWAALAHSCSAQPADLVRINDEVNRSIRWVPQRDGMDTAQVLPAEGDCDDYVWSKFILLSREGVAWERMRVAPVTYRRQDHVVLIVDGWVLDNIERSVVTVETARRYYTGL
jgi:predicted transglutaminase-like cysteine proteinase